MRNITLNNVKAAIRDVLQVSLSAFVIVTGMLVFTTVDAEAQGSYDPFVHSTIMGPAPLLPVEFGGTGVATLKAGNNGGSALIFPHPTDNHMGLVISLANGEPNVTDPESPTDALTALSGPLLAYFDFIYIPAIHTYVGTQKAEIPAYGSFQLSIAYRVVENTFKSGDPFAFNGLNVNVQPPGYTNPQPLDNDQASSYTYVEAFDYGDAPASYGVAEHEISLVGGPSSYANYFYLGGSVDPESSSQYSVSAAIDDVTDSNGDATPGDDDEDGVSIPALTAGSTVNIPVQVTFEGGTFAFFNAWIDWNGDGDFDDAGEQIAVNTLLFVSGTINLSVTVPADATTSPTYARFRIAAAPTGPSGAAATGEVEDYMISLSPTVAVISRVALKDVNSMAAFVWEVSLEIDTVGYHVEREENGTWVRVTSALIPAQTFVSGTKTYEIADAGASLVEMERYRIIEVDYMGREIVYGPYELSASGEEVSYEAWAAGINWNGADSDRDADPDGDGLTNFQEYLSGTDPLNANSVLRITRVRPVVDGVEVTWSSETGKVYTVQISQSLADEFLPVATGLEAEPPENTHVVPVDFDSVQKAFFRVLAE